MKTKNPFTKCCFVVVVVVWLWIENDMNEPLCTLCILKWNPLAMLPPIGLRITKNDCLISKTNRDKRLIKNERTINRSSVESKFFFEKLANAVLATYRLAFISYANQWSFMNFNFNRRLTKYFWTIYFIYPLIASRHTRVNSHRFQISHFENMQ